MFCYYMARGADHYTTVLRLNEYVQKKTIKYTLLDYI